MPDPVPPPLLRLAEILGVASRYTDGLGQRVEVGAETLTRVCAALGPPIDRVADARAALEEVERRTSPLLPPVIVAWDGRLPQVALGLDGASAEATLLLEDGGSLSIDPAAMRADEPLPPGYHRLVVESGRREAGCHVISTPAASWHPPAEPRARWGVAAQLAALRSSRSGSVGDLKDLAALCSRVRAAGGDVVTLLPLLPTFGDEPAEPSPYSPVSRLFWSELLLDLGPGRPPAPSVSRLDFPGADAAVRTALANHPAPDPELVDAELARYARFRGAQRRLGRSWRAWPDSARRGELAAGDVDPDEERFQLVAQVEVRCQLAHLVGHLTDEGIDLGLDLAVGVHPDGYDAWSRADLFAPGISVGAPPDAGFPSGQGWGFPPVLPTSSSEEGHAYIAAGIAHQASLAGVLRIDHIMAMSRLYWIPDGMGLAEGTYVDYPTEELFAVLCLESHRNRCALIGENLGTVPPAIDEALPRHDISGMYLAQFAAAADGPPAAPTPSEVAMIGTHDTPTFAGWLEGVDIDERARLGLLAESAVADAHRGRAEAAARLAAALDATDDDAGCLLDALLEWLGRSGSPLVMIWLEDLWLEPQPVNVPGSSSAQRPNWQRPMAGLLDELMADAAVERRLAMLDRARRSS